jgi:hypothetical protein
MLLVVVRCRRGRALVIVGILIRLQLLVIVVLSLLRQLL